MGKISDFSHLVSAIKEVHASLSAQAGKAINISLTLCNWLIGAYIAEYELRGSDRAVYGEKPLSELARHLTSSISATVIAASYTAICGFTGFIRELWGHCPHNCAKNCLLLCLKTIPRRVKKWVRRPHNSNFPPKG